jgi:hypothetical protein
LFDNQLKCYSSEKQSDGDSESIGTVEVNRECSKRQTDNQQLKANKSKTI